LTTDEIPDKLSKIDETSLMTSQDIENVNIHSENTEMKNETDSNTCTKSTQTERNSHLQDFDVECDMCFYKIKFNSAQRKGLRRSEFMKVIQESDKPCFQYTGVPSTSLLNKIFEWLKPATKKLKLWDGKKKLYTGGKSGGRKRRALSLFEEYILALYSTNTQRV